MTTGNRTNLIRLYVDASLAKGAGVALPPDQAHYVVNVMRKREGDGLLAFNGCDGEWRLALTEAKKKSARAEAVEQTRPQTFGPDVMLLFAPLKRARIDFIAQKATEMGAAVLQPVLTQHTIAERVKTERLRANAVEAAEQCNMLSVPEVREPEKLLTLLDGWDETRRILFCDEALEGADPPFETLRALPDADRTAPWAVLIGPEGGFDDAERNRLHAMPNAHAVSLGPRIMRADTAAVAALALWQAALGDWR